MIIISPDRQSRVLYYIVLKYNILRLSINNVISKDQLLFIKQLIDGFGASQPEGIYAVIKYFASKEYFTKLMNSIGNIAEAAKSVCIFNTLSIFFF